MERINFALLRRSGVVSQVCARVRMGRFEEDSKIAKMFGVALYIRLSNGLEVLHCGSLSFVHSSGY